MNTSRFITAFVVVWIVSYILSFILNVIVINWEGVPGMKTVMGIDSWIMGIIGPLTFAVMFCFLFVKGYEGKGISEGARFGVYIGLLMYLPLLFTHYAYYDYPASLIWGCSIGNFASTVILGIVVALIYKPKAT